jgi:iron-sulfur cluster assembly protein
VAITMTDFAVQRVSEIMKKKQSSDHYLRIGLRGGGCSGFMYSYEFISEPEEKDKIFDFGEVKICINIKSYLFLNGMEIDYEEDLLKSGLVFNAPQAQNSCGCGESISF